jgi:uracil-DNA glycosylase family 4
MDKNLYYPIFGLHDFTLRNNRNKQPQDSWEILTAEARACTACALHAGRTHVVFGSGKPTAKLMVIGEAPGFYEDKQGQPFVGRAGQLLTAMLQSIQLNREEDVYIANILKCRPPNNRDPQQEEISACTNFLERQIRLLSPTLLLAVGRIAAHYLLKTKATMESLRNRIHYFNNVPLIVTYHPAYLLRNPIDKKKAYQDLLEVRERLVN